MALQIQDAVKHQAKLRLAIYGPAGSGKTFTSLRMATGMGGSIVVIDSEKGRSEKYADKFKFKIIKLKSKNIEDYTEAIHLAEGAGFNHIIVDSLSHAWRELLNEVDAIAEAKFRGNTHSAWSKGTPKQMRFIETITESSAHIIATMRSKTEWVEERDDRGKIKPRRVGLAPQQGKEIEYEFDMLMQLNTDHIAVVEKDITGKFQDQMIEKPGEDLGRALMEWLNTGAAVPAEPTARERIQKAKSAFVERGADAGRVQTYIDTLPFVTDEDAVVEHLKSKFIEFNNGRTTLAKIFGEPETRMLNEAELGQLLEYQERFKVTDAAFLQHLSDEYGVSTASELSAQTFPKLVEWIMRAGATKAGKS